MECFDIIIKEKAMLTGGIIVSTASAEKNSLTTESVTTTDLINSASTQASNNGALIITNETELKALTGQEAEKTIASLNCDTATAHQAEQLLDIHKLEQIVHENREMTTQLLKECFKYSDESSKMMRIKKHSIVVMDHDKDGKIIYRKDAK
ncbi:hypothetical protein [Bartonella machadoae]|uniref:hypothetical protein n=1 Tax=Bartonella machadoae TaxID=2893471 RepID=UPI001F4C9B92|nr:hypothetical protein [Bartonella machadoae]UNE54774.1 hypothetical protein LNM86_02525 [Bartonella machadoae]